MSGSNSIGVLLFVVLLPCCLAVQGCGDGIGLPSDDDDTSVSDDDDSVVGDDDDTSLADDDDTSLADDDDTGLADDDDTSVADDDDDTSVGDDDDTTPAAQCPSWSFDGDVGPWDLANGMSLSAPQEAGSVRFDTTADPHLWVETSADLSSCTLIEVVMKVTGEHGPWQVFWQRSQDTGFAEARSRRFHQFADEEWFRYVFDLSDHPEWDGSLSWLRLDPHAGPGSVSIRSIALVEPQGQFPPALDLAQVHWLHTDVSPWPVTSTLSSVNVGPSTICLDHDQANTWTPVDIAPDVAVNANPWVFIWRPDLAGAAGTWYGATWEWIRPGQACKQRYAVAGDHIKRSPFHINSGWAPSSGETLHFMVSGLARSSERNQEEHSNVVQVVWP